MGEVYDKGHNKSGRKMSTNSLNCYQKKISRRGLFRRGKHFRKAIGEINNIRKRGEREHLIERNERGNCKRKNQLKSTKKMRCGKESTKDGGN